MNLCPGYLIIVETLSTARGSAAMYEFGFVGAGSLFLSKHSTMLKLNSTARTARSGVVPKGIFMIRILLVHQRTYILMAPIVA